MADVKTVRLEDGNFRLSRYRYEGGFDWWFIEHRCHHGGWVGFSGDPRICEIPCRVCGGIIPEGLHAVFWFMKLEGAWV